MFSVFLSATLALALLLPPAPVLPQMRTFLSDEWAKLSISLSSPRGENRERFSTFEHTEIASYIRDQGNTRNCWAYAMNAMLEIKLKLQKNLSLNLSEEAVITGTPMGADDYSGGNYHASLSYYLERTKPLLIKKYRLLSGIDAAKEAIRKNGSVLTQIYYSEADKVSFDSKRHTYFNNNKEKGATHEIILVGFDDAYPRHLFKIPPSSDGAFLALNSFGLDWGDNGLFYISYEDGNVTKEMVTVDDLETTEEQTPDGNLSVPVSPISDSLGTPTHFLPFGKEHSAVLYQEISHTGIMKNFRPSVSGDIPPSRTIERKSLYGFGIFHRAGQRYDILLERPQNVSEDSIPLLSASFDADGYTLLSPTADISLHEGDLLKFVISGKDDFLIPVEAPFPQMDYRIPRPGIGTYLEAESERIPLSSVFPDSNFAFKLFLSGD